MCIMFTVIMQYHTHNYAAELDIKIALIYTDCNAILLVQELRKLKIITLGLGLN